MWQTMLRGENTEHGVSIFHEECTRLGSLSFKEAHKAKNIPERVHLCSRDIRQTAMRCDDDPVIRLAAERQRGAKDL
jgi:hypothetical protein